MTEIPAAFNAPKMTEAEARIVGGIDHKRRQSLLILLGLTFGGTILLLLLAVIASVIFAPTSTATQGFTTIVGVAFNAAIFGVTVYFARRGNVETAAALFAIGAGLLPNLNVLASVLAGSGSPFSLVFLMGAITIVSLAGKPWMIFATAALSSFSTVIMFLNPPAALIALYATNKGTIPILFVAYWGLALILLAQYRSYQGLLSDLAEVIIQVERARKLDALKDQFIRSVNHELRTPIMTVLGYVDLLANPQNQEKPDRVERYVSRAQRAGQSLRTLLASILDTRRMNADQEVFEPQAVDIFTTIESTVSLIPTDQRDGQVIERDLNIHMPHHLKVWADPIKLQQILTNLLGNAVKYSEPGTPIDINVREVSETELPGNRWLRQPTRQRTMIEIGVHDHGLGIPLDQQSLLFQRFARLQRDLESDVVGTGLGLYLCKTWVENMGGTIQVQSTGIEGDGSTFLVRLPIPA